MMVNIKRPQRTQRTRRFARISLAAFLFFGVAFGLGAQEGRTSDYRLDETGKIPQRLSWTNVNAYFYVVELEKEVAGNWESEYKERTERTYIAVSLPPGRYRYRILSYNVLGRVGSTSEWTILRVTEAMEPELKSFSPSRVNPDSETLNFTISLKGKRLVEGADIYLVEKGKGSSTNGDQDASAQTRFRHVSASYGEDDETAEVVFSGIAQGTYDIVVVNPGGLSIRGKGPRVGEPRAARETDAYTLDGQKFWSIGPRAEIGVPQNETEVGYDGYTMTGIAVGGGVRYTFLEKYKDRGKFFILPNSFFAEANFVYSSADWADDGSAYRFEETSTSGEIWLGALYKIRVAPNQRWIVNLGLSVGVIYSHQARHEDSGGPPTDYTGNDFGVGLGMYTGAEFRVTPLWSVDFGISLRPPVWKPGDVTPESGGYASLGVTYRKPYR